MGIRLALGATQCSIVWVALRDGIIALACGAAAGVALAIAAIRPLAGALPDGVTPWDPPCLPRPRCCCWRQGASAGLDPEPPGRPCDLRRAPPGMIIQLQVPQQCCKGGRSVCVVCRP